MNLFSVTGRRVPGISGFLKRNPMFAELSAPKPTTRDLLKSALEALRSGKYRPGDRFPDPGQMALLTGASLVDCLDTVTELLKSGSIRQHSSGLLSVPPATKSDISKKA